MNVIEHTMLGIDRILNGSSKRAAATARKPQVQTLGNEGSSPLVDLGTAEVGRSYPVTCEARYYDAASQLLESEPHLLTHDNADELGHVIQKWMEETRNSWVRK